MTDPQNRMTAALNQLAKWRPSSPAGNSAPVEARPLAGQATERAEAERIALPPLPPKWTQPLTAEGQDRVALEAALRRHLDPYDAVVAAMVVIEAGWLPPSIAAAERILLANADGYASALAEVLGDPAVTHEFSPVLYPRRCDVCTGRPDDARHRTPGRVRAGLGQEAP
jgi:hypothetical protein